MNKINTTLKKSDEWKILEEIFKDAPVGLGVVDTRFSFIKVNKALSRMNNVSQKLHEGKSVSDIVGLKYWKQIKKHYLEILKNKKTVNFEISVLLKTQPPTYAYYKTSLYPLKDNNEIWGIGIVVHDITEKKITEDTLVESEERFRATTDSVPVLIRMTDAKGETYYVNKSWTLFTGTPVEEIIKKGWLEFVHPDERVTTAKRLTQISYLHKPYQIEYRLKNRNGEYRWMLERGVPRFSSKRDLLGYVCSSLDITERKVAEERKNEHNRYISSILESTTEGLYGMDLEGKITFINTSALKLLGYTEKQILGQNAHDLFHYKYRNNSPYPVVDCPYHSAIVNGKPTGFIEDTFWSKNGNSLPVLASCSPLIISGKIKGGIVAIVDLREHKKAMDVIRQSESRFATLIDQSPFSIQILDTNGKTIRVNKAWEELWGATIDDVKNYNILTDKQLKDTGALEYVKKAFNGQSVPIPPIEYDPNITLKGGNFKKRWLQAFIYPIKDNEGNIREVVLMHDDITSQKRSEQDLALYQERLEMAQSAGGIGVFELNLVNNKIWWSDQELRVYGVDQLSEDNKAFANLICPDDREITLQLVDQAIAESKEFDIEFRVITPDQRLKWIKGKGHALYDKDGKPVKVIGVNYDITERKNSEDLLRFKAEASKVLSSSLDYRKTLLQIAELAVEYIADWCAVDILSDEGELELLTVVHKDPKKVAWGKKLRKKYPVNMNEEGVIQTVLKQKTSVFYPDITQSMVESAARNEEELKLVKKINYSAFIAVPLIVNDKAIGAIEIVSTESKRKYNDLHLEMAQQLASRASLAIENAQLYEAVEAERERLNNLLSKVPGVVWEAWGRPDDERQSIDFVSEYVEEMLGYTQEEWLKTPNFWLKIVHPEDKERASAEALEIFEKGKLGISRFRWLKKDKTPIWVESYSYVIKDKKGKHLGMRGVTMDITDRVREEKRKDEFISMASHELKTPVTSIKAFTQLLSQSFRRNGDTETVRYLDRMDAQINKLTNLISDLLDVSKIEKGRLQFHYEQFWFDELIRDIVDDIQASSVSHKIVVSSLPHFKLIGDKDRVSQVMINLITNAIKYSPNSTKITLTVKVSIKEVTVSVQDYGVGIPKVHHKRIFERFYRVYDEKDRQFPGLGIGLYISSEIVQRHGGKMWFHSTKGKGSTFYFSLPMENAHTAHEAN